MRFRLGELFCGPGGIGWAASKAALRTGGKTFSIQHEWAIDIHEDSCRTFLRNIPGASSESVFCADVRAMQPRMLTAIDGLAFGFPCNDFSLVGERKGLKGKFGPLYREGIRFLREKQPLWFFAENVSGLRADKSALEMILREMEEAGKGYAITPHLYRFEEYGIPQRRHRVIIVGIRLDQSLTFEVPKPSQRLRTAREALAGIPPDAANQEPTRQSKQVVERLKRIQPGKNAFNTKMPAHLTLNVRGARLSNIYKRLDPDKPAYTVTGSGGGGTHVYHWEEPRALTNRERARLQTFDDEFVFEGTKESTRRQIGMAVPPAGAQIILEAILKTFAGKPYASVPPNIRREKQGYLYHHARQAI